MMASHRLLEHHQPMEFDRHLSIGESTRLRLPVALLDAMRDELPFLTQQTIADVVAEVPAYTDAVGAVRRLIDAAVHQTIAAFVELVAQGLEPDSSPGDPALEAGYALGRQEARAGHSSEMLLAAYRIGARTVWRRWSSLAVAQQLPGAQLAVFAESIFAYMDRLSAAAVGGHAEEVAKSGLARQRARELLVRQLLVPSTAEELRASAERAEWAPPRTLTAVAVPTANAVAAARMIDHRTLDVPEDAVHIGTRSVSLVLVPDVGAAARSTFLAAVAVDGMIVGPARPWTRAGESVHRVLRTLTMGLGTEAVTDTEALLPELMLGADEQALRDLRTHVLAPLQDLRPVVRANLLATLRSWLLNHGRREDIAAELFVHSGTVRYRMSQLRDLYGERLKDPRTVLELTLALGIAPSDEDDARGG